MKYSDWLTKEQAAAALQVSTKTVEKFAADKLLNSAMVKNPETGATRVMFHPREVAKLRKKRLPDAEPFVLPKDGDGDPPARRAAGAAVVVQNPLDRAFMAQPNESIGQALVKTLADGMTRATAQMFERQAATVPLHRRLYLTRAEAAQYSGLPQSEIVKRIESRELPAIRTGRGWRIPRRDLERLQIYDVWSGAKVRPELAAPPAGEPPPSGFDLTDYRRKRQSELAGEQHDDTPSSAGADIE